MAIERTLVILKPDALGRKLTQRILRDYIRPLGLSVREVDFYEGPSQELEQKVALHYNKDDAWCLKWGGRRHEAKKTTWDSEIQGSLPNALEFGHAIRAQLYECISAAPVAVFIFEGEDAVARVRSIVGETDPIAAPKGTIRGDLREKHTNMGDRKDVPLYHEEVESITYAGLCDRAVRNLVHASDSVEEAEREIGIWFS